VPAAKQPKAKAPRIKYPVNAELPPLSLLDPPRTKEHTGNNAEEMGAELMKKLKEFGVVATLSSIVEGPTVTQFAVKPGHGVRVEKFLGLSRDLQLALKAKSLLFPDRRLWAYRCRIRIRSLSCSVRSWSLILGRM